MLLKKIYALSTLQQKPLDKRRIVRDNSWSRILFQVKRSNAMVGVSLHSSECQSFMPRSQIIPD